MHEARTSHHCTRSIMCVDQIKNCDELKARGYEWHETGVCFDRRLTRLLGTYDPTSHRGSKLHLKF